MPAPALDYSITFPNLVIELSFNDGQWSADPQTSPLPNPFSPVLAQCLTVSTQSTQLDVAKVAADSRVVRASRRLGDFARRFGRTLAMLVKDDYADPLYVVYFDSERPGDYRKPISSGRLPKMQAWLPRLQTSTEPTLAAFAPELVDLLAVAESALGAQVAAGEQIKTFESGDKKALVDEANSARKLAYGQISQMRYSQAGLRLPTDFAEGFFLHREPPRKIPSGDYEALIKKAQAKVLALQAKQADAKAREDAAEAKKTKADAKKAKVADAKQGVKAAEDHLKEVESE